MSSIGVYLVRHEEAEPSSFAPDHLRALTARGRVNIRNTAKAVAEQPGLIELMYTSPLVRAVQTAEVLAGAMSLEEVQTSEVISNPPSLEALIELITEAPGNVGSVALVGHEPTMSYLAARLVKRREFPRPFRTGTVLKLNVDRKTAVGTFEWIMQSPGPTRFDTLDP